MRSIPSEGLGPADYRRSPHRLTQMRWSNFPLAKARRCSATFPSGWTKLSADGRSPRCSPSAPGNPLSCTANEPYNTNYDELVVVYARPGGYVRSPHHAHFDQTRSPEPVRQHQRRGGLRAWLCRPSRRPRHHCAGLTSGMTMLAVSKFFKLPKEGYRLQFRAEAYNLLNHEIFAQSVGLYDLAVSRHHHDGRAFRRSDRRRSARSRPRQQGQRTSRPADGVALRVLNTCESRVSFSSPSFWQPPPGLPNRMEPVWSPGSCPLPGSRAVRTVSAFRTGRCTNTTTTSISCGNPAASITRSRSCI